MVIIRIVISNVFLFHKAFFGSSLIGSGAQTDAREEP
jgi:hypothetical protein